MSVSKKLNGSKPKSNGFHKHSQLWLDAGCGSAKQPNCVGMDKRSLPGVDVVHDIETTPWPFTKETFDRIIMSHVMEHINPSVSVDVMNEMWRIMKPDGVLMLSMPYAGSFGHWQDPTHIKPWNEATCHYFDPDMPLWGIYQPKPWKIEANVWRAEGNIEIILRKRARETAQKK
jgi:SAM-dependent methyltransferase